MMSDVGEDLPCTGLEGDPAEGAENKMQQETTIEAPEHQRKTQGPLSERKTEPSSDGQSSKDDKGIAAHHLPYLNISGHTKASPVVAGMMSQHSQLTQSSAVDEMMSQLPQPADSSSAAGIRSQITQKVPSASETRMKSRLSQVLSADAAEVKLQLSQQRESAARIKSWLTRPDSSTVETTMKSQLTQIPSAATAEARPHLSQAEFLPGSKMKSKLAQQDRSAAIAELRSRLIQQGELSSAAGTKSRRTHVAPSATSDARPQIPQKAESASEAKMRSFVSQFLSAAVDKIMPQRTQQSESDSSAEIKLKIPQQAPPIDEARMRAYVTEFLSAAAEDMMLQLSRQAEAAAATKMGSQLTQKDPSIVAAGGMSPVTPELPSAVARIMSQPSPPCVVGKNMQLNEQAVGGNETLLPKQTLPSVARETDPIPQQLPTVSTTSAPSIQKTSKAERKVKLTAACLPSWKDLTMVEARRGRVAGAPPAKEDSQDSKKRLHPSARDLPEINVQNINKGIKGHKFQKLLPSQTKQPPYRSLTERMYLEGMMKVVDLTKEKKKKKRRSRYGCDDGDLSEESWTTASSSDEQKSPTKSIPSSPELQFHLEF